MGNRNILEKVNIPKRLLSMIFIKYPVKNLKLLNLSYKTVQVLKTCAVLRNFAGYALRFDRKFEKIFWD